MAEHGQSKATYAGRVKDVRGRRVTQLDPVAMRLFHQHDGIDADALRAIANEEGVRIKGGERVALIGGICGALLVIFLFSYEVITGGILDALSAKTGGFFYLCSMPWIIWFGIKRKRFGNVAASMLKYLRCPHCGYYLRGLPIDPADGATICPECGCAWRLEDIAE